MVFNTSSSRNAVDQEFINTILDTDNVVSLVEYESNIQPTRDFTVVFNALSAVGETDAITVDLGVLFNG